MRATDYLLATSLLVACLAAAACSELFPKRSPGEKLWRQRCSECHGLDARGNTPRFVSDSWADLTDDSWRGGWDETAWEIVIREGTFGKMPANPDLTREQIRQLITHLKELRKQAGA